jgi:hypothetical protein
MTVELGRLPRSLRTVGLLLLLLGTLAFWIFYLEPARGADAARRWTATPCQIVSIERILRKGKRSHTKVSLEVTYEYTAGGREHQASLYRFGGHVSEPEISDALARFRSGGQAFCWVDPDDPERAVLLQGFSPKPADVAFAVGCLITGAGLLVVSWLLQRRSVPPPPGL